MLRWQVRSTALLFAAAVLVISGCARPRDDNLTAFAKSTSALATAAKSAGDLNIEIDGKIKLARAATTFANGGPTDDPDFPANTGVFLGGKSGQDWQAIVAFLDAISDYADALAKANDPKLETGISDKLSGLGTAVAKAATARDAARGNALAASRQQHIQAIGGVVTDIAFLVTNIYAGHVIQETMKAVQPRLEDARLPLKQAIRAVVRSDRGKLALYREAVAEKLTAASEDKQFLAKYDAYVAVNQDFIALQGRISALGGLQGAVDAMIEAHATLMKDLDNTAALVQFLQTVSDIVDKVEKAEALRKQT